jgi:predicted nucleotidyltransferase
VASLSSKVSLVFIPVSSLVLQDLWAHPHVRISASGLARVSSFIECLLYLGMMPSGTDPRDYFSSRRAELYERYGIQSIKIFGSYARGDSRPDSDLDLIIEVEKPYRFDLLGLIALEQQISEELGVEVDLILEEDLKPGVARRAHAEALSI